MNNDNKVTPIIKDGELYTGEKKPKRIVHFNFYSINLKSRLTDENVTLQKFFQSGNILYYCKKCLSPCQRN